MPSLIIPAETTYYDIERDLIDNEPPGLFPEDQNSVWGQVRHVFAEHMQLNIANALAQWYINLDPRTVVTADMPEWEEMLGIPAIPASYVSSVPDAYRRALILTRYEKGPFTRARRNRVIEQFIGATFGTSLSFGVDGIPMSAPGQPLYADTIALKSSYRVYEDVQNYAYQVQILSSITPDTATLLRELKRITPAPTSLNVTIDNTVTDVLDYGLATRNTQPVASYRLSGNANDSSGNGLNGTLSGGPASVASPGLLNALAGTNACYDFDGVDDHVALPVMPLWANATAFTVSAWINVDAYNAGGHMSIVSKDDGLFFFSVLQNGMLHGQTYLSTVQNYNQTPAGVIPLNTTKFVVFSYDGAKLRLYVNAVNVSEWSGTGVPRLDGTWRIGAYALGTAANRMNGRIDEVNFHNYALSDAQITELYNQGIGVA